MGQTPSSTRQTTAHGAAIQLVTMSPTSNEGTVTIVVKKK